MPGFFAEEPLWKADTKGSVLKLELSIQILSKALFCVNQTEFKTKLS